MFGGGPRSRSFKRAYTGTFPVSPGGPARSRFSRLGNVRESHERRRNVLNTSNRRSDGGRREARTADSDVRPSVVNPESRSWQGGAPPPRSSPYAQIRDASMPARPPRVRTSLQRSASVFFIFHTRVQTFLRPRRTPVALEPVCT